MFFRFFLLVNKVELLKVNVELNGIFVFISEVSIGGLVLFVKVINVYMLGLIFFLNKDMIEVNIYFCIEVNCVFGVLIIKYSVLMKEIFWLFDVENKCFI